MLVRNLYYSLSCLVKNNGLKSSELKLVESIIEENQEVIAEHWNKFFNKAK